MRWIVLALALLPGGQGRQKEITAAFEAARRGDIEPASKLKPTAADVPVIAGYLRDPSENARREAVVLLEEIGGQAACFALAAPVTDTSADVRERAARAIHHKCPPGVTARMPKLEPALRESVKMGNPSASALLLLGRYRSGENRGFLKQVSEAGRSPVKLDPWSGPVPESLAASVAGTSAGLPDAGRRVAEGLKPLEGAAFLVSVLPDITDTAVLRDLVKLLDDQRTVALGVPSGAQPQRRISDLAVDAFVARLKLKPSFRLRPSDRYSAKEVEEVKVLAGKALAGQ